MTETDYQSGIVNPIGDILLSIPEFHKLHISTRNEVANFIERKLRKLSLKLKVSPYSQYTQVDSLGVNSNFAAALRSWLLQFDEKHRLGLLAATLCTIYVTEDEIDSFIEIGLARLRDEILEAAELDKRRIGSGAIPDWAVLKKDIRCYAISEFGAYEKVIRKLSISGSRDRLNHPVHGIVDEFVKTTFQKIRGLADKELQSLIYHKQWAEEVAELIRSLRNSHIVLIEDGSFSGKRIKRETSRFLKLMNILFSGFKESMANHGYTPPWVYLLVVFGTENALDAVQSLGPLGGRERLYERFVPVFGHIFERNASVQAGIPPAIEELGALLQKPNFAKKLRESIYAFHTQYSQRYWDRETEIRKMLTLNDKDLPYGLGGKGWTLVTHVNCPNSSLPVLWYPHVESETKHIKPLFARLESQNRRESMQELRESIEIASKDQDHCLHNFLHTIHQEP